MSNVILYGTGPSPALNKIAIKCTANGELSVDDGANPLGAQYNIQNGALAGSTYSTALELNNTYKNCILSYIDTASSGVITVWGSVSLTDSASTYMYIGVISPTGYRAGMRMGSLNLNLGGFKWIKIYNESASSLSGVGASLISA